MFRRKDLEDTLFNAILNGNGLPDRATSTAFKRKRFNRCARALLSRNLFIPIVKRPNAESDRDVVTGYSQPLETDVMLWGFTWTQTQVEPFELGRTMKISVNGHELISNVAVSQSTLSEPVGQGFGNAVAGYGTSELPCPVRVPAGSRIAAEFSYNPSRYWGSSDGHNATVMNTTQYDSVVLMCIGVKTCLSDEDKDLLEKCRQWIEAHEFQDPVFLNSVSLPTDQNLNIFWDGDFGGGGLDVTATSQTRNVSAPLLVRGLGTNLALSRFAIRDTRDHQFMPAGKVLAQNFSSYKGQFVVVSTYFRWLIPHVLAPGAQLVTDHLDGTGAAIGAFSYDGRAFAPADDEPAHQNWLVYPCVTP
jgi:hypothetical protein